MGQGSGVVGPGDSGAYVALVPPVGPSAGFSLVLETVGKAGGNLTVQLTGGLPGPGTTLHVWQTTEVSGWSVTRHLDVVVAVAAAVAVLVVVVVVVAIVVVVVVAIVVVVVAATAVVVVIVDIAGVCIGGRKSHTHAQHNRIPCVVQKRRGVGSPACPHAFSSLLELEAVQRTAACVATCHRVFTFSSFMA